MKCVFVDCRIRPKVTDRLAQADSWGREREIERGKKVKWAERRERALKK